MRDYQKDLEVCEKATKGPWDIRGHWGSVHGKVIYSGVGEENRTIANFPYGNVVGLPEGWQKKDKVYQQLLANVEFIALSRTALPWYIRRVMKLDSQLQQAEEMEGLLEKAAEEIENCYGRETELSQELRRVINNSPSQPSRYQLMEAVVEAARELVSEKDRGLLLMYGKSEKSQKELRLLDALTALDRAGEGAGK